MPWPWVLKLLDYWHITPPINESLAALAREQRFAVVETMPSQEAMDANNRMASMTMTGSAGRKAFADLPPFMQSAIMASRQPQSKAVN